MKKRTIPRCKEELFIVVEGYTEEALIQKLKELYEAKYNIKIKKAYSGNNIVDKYHDIKKIYPYHQVIVLYDLDNSRIVSDIIKIFKERNIPVELENIYFINPFVELLFVLCKEKKALTSITKKQYSLHIKRIFNINEYKSTEEQVNKLLKQLEKEDLNNLQKNITEIISSDDKELPSTNFLQLMQRIFNI